MIQFRPYRYTGDLFGGDFLTVRDFFIRQDIPAFPFGWWDHQITRPGFSPEVLPRLGLWFDGERLVAVACTEEDPGSCILCAEKGYDRLYDEMAVYAVQNLHHKGHVTFMIPDLCKPYQRAAARLGFLPSQDRDTESILEMEGADLGYTLPEGFRIVSLGENCDLIRLERILRRAFTDDTEERVLDEAGLLSMEHQFHRPLINLDLQVAAVAPDGSFAAFCGMWQTPESDMAFIEPVATDPDYRKRGLGKAVVYEAMRRCAGLGARRAVVFSSIPFYFHLGFHPNSTVTWWVKREEENQ